MSKKSKGKRVFVHAPNHGLPHSSTIILSPMVIRVLPRTSYSSILLGSAPGKSITEIPLVTRPGYFDVLCVVTIKKEDAQLLANRSISQILTKIELVITETALTRRGDSSSPSSTQNPL